jgi:hypothetical protein
MYRVKFIIIQSLNTHALNLHFKDISVDPNLLAHHIFFVFVKKNKNKNVNNEMYNALQQSSFFNLITMVME